jgi:hypothetical protein
MRTCAAVERFAAIAYTLASYVLCLTGCDASNGASPPNAAAAVELRCEPLVQGCAHGQVCALVCAERPRYDCVATRVTPAAAPGAACAGSAECSAKQVCAMLDADAGSGRCVVRCRDERDCPVGTVCSPSPLSFCPTGPFGFCL